VDNVIAGNDFHAKRHWECNPILQEIRLEVFSCLSLIFTQWKLKFPYQIISTQTEKDSYTGQWQQLWVTFQLRSADYPSDMSNKRQPSEAHEPEITWSEKNR